MRTRTAGHGASTGLPSSPAGRYTSVASVTPSRIGVRSSTSTCALGYRSGVAEGNSLRGSVNRFCAARSIRTPAHARSAFTWLMPRL